eukprot:6491834-Amphidinium_carterae.1
MATGTPAQPMPTQMGTLYNVRAVINVNEETPQSYKGFRAIILDPGTAVSVSPQSFCPHVMTEDTGRQYVTVSGEGLNIEGDDNGHRQDHLASQVHCGQCAITTDWST